MRGLSVAVVCLLLSGTAGIVGFLVDGSWILLTLGAVLLLGGLASWFLGSRETGRQRRNVPRA